MTHPAASPLLHLLESLSLPDIPTGESLRAVSQPPKTRQRCVPSSEGLVALGDAIPALDAYSVLKILPEHSLRVRSGEKSALFMARHALPEPADPPLESATTDAKRGAGGQSHGSYPPISGCQCRGACQFRATETE